MYVALEARTPCWMCGYFHRVIRCVNVRVNKNSLKETGMALISVGTRICPECGEPNLGELIPVSAYFLTGKDAAKVIAYREQKWGVSDGTGPLVEARQKHQRGEVAAA